MKKSNFVVSLSALTVVLSLNVGAASNNHSVQAVAESGETASHGSASLAHGIIASGQVASAVSAVPLAIGGSAGNASAEISKDLMEAANAPIGTPLEITDETVTVGPRPNEALSTKEQNDNIDR